MAFTYFFRDLHTLEMLCEHTLPFLKTKEKIHIWDAGCAMGQEPYTLSMLLREKCTPMYFRNVHITGSDIDISNRFRKIIGDGIYKEEEIRRVPPLFLSKYFIPADKENCYQIVEEIRDSISFCRHDLTTLEPIGENLSIVLCKNVLLHLTENQRVQVIQMFYDALMEGGFLVLEQTQKLPTQVKHLFEPIASNAQLFRKVTCPITTRN